MKGVCHLKMAVPSNTLLISLSWLIWCSVAANGQVKPNNVDTYFPPVFVYNTANRFGFQIDEKANVSSVVGRIASTDASPLGPTVYELVNPSPEFFALNRTDGTITLVKSLFNYLDEQYNFQVRAYDTGEPVYVATGAVTVIVLRNAGSGPVFTLDPYYRQVHETFPVGNLLIDTTAIDIDGDALLYSLSGNAADLEYFFVDPIDGELFLRSSLVNPPKTQFSFQILASDQRRVNPKVRAASVIIDVDTDSKPYFTSGTSIPVLQETATANTIVHTLVAQDDDLTRNSTLQYELVGISPAEYMFAVNSITRAITLVRNIRGSGFDNRNQYVLRVIAYDPVYRTNSATQTLTVNVNVNPNIPQFIPDNSYEESVNETVSPGYNVVTVLAIDSDNDPLKYSLIRFTNDSTSWFALIDNRIVIRDQLTRAPLNQYTLTIQVEDGRGSKAEATVTITILRNPTDKAPIFLNLDVPGQGSGVVYRATIRYDHQVGTTVSNRPSARDDDLQGSLVFEAVADAPALEYFTIDRNNGLVTLKKDLQLDIYESVLYRMYLVVYDSARSANQASALLLITIDRNPSSPRFANPTLSFTVNEREPIGFRINQLTATDPDARDVIAYSVAPGYTNGTLMFFYLNEKSALLTVASDLRDSRPYGNQYQFQVIANDQGKPPKSASLSVTIFVERDEFPPAFVLSAKNETITDKHLKNTFVISVFAEDRDRKGTIVYELVGDGNAMAYFGIDRNTGFINLIKDIKTTRDTVFRLVLQAYDSFYPTNRATMYMYIFVQRNSDIIVFDPPPSYFVEVNEYRQLFNEIYRVSATDPDGDSVSYRISTNPLAQEYFFIATEGQFGVLYIKKSLASNQLNDTYVFLIEARDSRQFDTQNSTRQMTVRVLRNQRPVILNTEREITVDERTPIGDRIYVIEARDPDLMPGSNLHYQVFGEGLAPGLFQIADEKRGFITVASNLMRDKSQAYNLTVIVYDFELPDLVAYYTIKINMLRNANAPVFTANPYRSNLDWRDLPGKIVATILATDADNDRVTYSLGINPVEVAEYFRVNSDNGNIVLLKTLPARRESFSIIVQARDNAAPEKFAQSSVELTIDIDRFGPIFDPANTIISMSTEETRPIGTVIGSVTARDNDRRGVIVYEVIGEYPGDNFFGVNSTTGQVYIINNLKEDTLARSLYTLFIDAYDSLVPDNRARTQVQITVLRNQGFPEFDRASYNEQIDEFHQLAVSVVNITARDIRDNDQITYRMIDESANKINSQFFYIEPSTGVIYLRKPLTESTVDSFSFRVEATDDGRPARSRDVSVVLRVMRVGLPTFSPPFSTVVPKTDAGAINNCSTTAFPDTDIDKLRPVWDHPDCSACFAPLYTSTLTESYKNIALLVQPKRLLAIDAIPTSGSKLLYSIDSGNTHGIFQIDNETGEVTVLRSVLETGYMGDTLRLAIRVQKDIAGRGLSNIAVLIVDINGRNTFATNTTPESKDYTGFIIGLVILSVLLLAVIVVLAIFVVRQKRVEKSIPQYEIPAPRQGDNGYARYNISMVRLGENTMDESVNFHDNRLESEHVYDDPDESRNMADHPGNSEHRTTLN